MFKSARAGSSLFMQILQNQKHVLHHMLPPVRNVPYSLRIRAHDREVPVANATVRKNFIHGMLYIFGLILTSGSYITGIIMNSPVLYVKFYVCISMLALCVRQRVY